MKVDQLQTEIHELAHSFGERDKNNAETKLNSILRVNLGDDQKCPYFGFIRPEEEASGLYSDFSLVIFPEFDSNRTVTSFLVSLTVGSQGFKNDYELALQPGWRRHFLKLKSENSFFKTDFSDTTSTLEPLFRSEAISEELKKSLHEYKSDVLAAEVFTINPSAETFDTNIQEKVKAWVATYALLRGWATNNKIKKYVQDSLPKSDKYDENSEQSEIKGLLRRHKYIVLQGAPGSGKTYTASKIANEWVNKNGEDSVFFTQFHAETTYSDFVWGIEPTYSSASHAGETGSLSMSFREKKGILMQAIEAASKSDKDVLLIIDEINRANLPNVLGPVFYLFEKNTGANRMCMHLGPNNTNENLYSKLPDNLYVLATMNTADRSLAVVDFALRRRFIWYTMHPHVINSSNFRKDAFEEMESIFMQHAKDEELPLQPGQSYFLEDDDIKFEERAKYELLPLIKEYLAEGRLTSAKDSFSKYFETYANSNLFE